MKHTLKIQNTILLLSILFASCTSCKKPIVEPSYKQGYYFYCKVDGKDFIQAKKTGIGGNSPQTAYNNDSLVLVGSLSESFERAIINVNKIISQSPFILNKPFGYSNENSAYFTRNDLSLNTLSTDSLHTGTMIITNIDTKNKIIEGNFSFKAINYALQDSVNITDGKFSLYYEKY